MGEARKTFRIVNRLGLHARAATMLAKEASRYSAVIRLQTGDQQARASSVLELLQLCGEVGTEMTVVADGEDAERAVKAIGDLIRGRFGEGR